MTSTTSTEPVLTACPSWCAGEHWTSDHEGDLGMHAATTRRERWEVEGALFFNHDRSEHGREVRIRITSDDGLTPDQARQLARDLTDAADMLTPAGPGSIAVVQALADELGGTIEVPEQATQGDIREICLRLGEQIGRRS